MKIRVAVKSCLPCLLGIAFGWCAFADVDVDSLLQESAMWLDASDPVLFQLNETGGVTNWINRSTSGRAAYGDAKAYHVNPNKPQCFGAVELVNGAPAYQMFSIGSYVDLTYGRISTIRTVFLVGDFENKNSAWNPLLGDSAACNFHRGQNGEFVHATYRDYKGTITAWHNSATTTVNSSLAKPTTGAMNFIILATAGNTQSDLLSGDRTTRASGAMPDRCAGRALHEVIIFTRALTDAERMAVYDYLYAKWHDGGWNKGQYETLSAFGGPTDVSFTDDVTVGAATDAEKRLLAKTISVVEGKTATLAGPLTGGSVNLTGGGTLAFAHGAAINGRLTQAGGTLDLGGGTFTSFYNPVLSGTVTFRDGVFDLRSYLDRFHPSANTHIILDEGASLINGYDFFMDMGNVVFEMRENAGVAEMASGCFGLTVDYATSNTLIIAGGTLVATNYVADASDNYAGVIKILTQDKNGRAVMNMTGGAILARRISVAGSWNTNERVKGRADVDIAGGTITLGDDFAIGANNSTHGTANVHFGGGTVTAPNGLHMYYNDTDTVTFDGTTFVATKDNANYFNFAKSASANVTVAAGGLVINDGGFALGIDFGKISGAGPVVKRGAGTLTLGNAEGFAGSIRVEAGTVALATGSTQMALNAVTLDGATAKLVLGLNRFTGPFALGAGGTLDVVVTKSGFNAIAPAAEGFDVSKLALITRNEQGTVLTGGIPVVEDGVFGVRMPETYVAAVADGTTSDWFALPWTFSGVAMPFPEADGVVVEANLNASGTSAVSLGKTVYSPLTKVLNADDGAAQVALKGPAEHVGRINLADFFGTVRVEEVNVVGEIALGERSTFEFHAAAGETWTGGVYRVTGGTALKTGAGTFMHAGIPDAAIDVTEGSLGLLVAEDASISSLAVTSASNAGAFEKHGAGTLTLTGTGPSGVQVKVLEGTFAVAKNAPGGMMMNVTATAERPFYVGPGATAIFDGDNFHSDRLPYDASIAVDGGTLILRGVNPFHTGNPPNIGVTNGLVELNHYAGNEHIKFKSLTMADSTFRFTGTKTAVSSQGAMMQSPFAITTSGACLFDQAEGGNKFAGDAEIQLTVADGVTTWNIPTKSVNVRVNQGAGVLRFGPKMSASETTFIVTAGGKVANGVADGVCAKLQFEDGSTLKAANGAPLKVTTLALPSSGTVTLDLTGIDFTTREAPVTVLDCTSFTPAMAEKLTVVGMPGAPWAMSTSGGIMVKRLSQPRDLVWNTGDGEWSATAWNNDPAGYGMDGYHHVSFADRASGTAGSPVAVTITEDRCVNGFDFTAATTPYRLSGAGIVTMPTFAITGTAGFAIASPVSVLQGTFAFAPTTADQEVLDVRGTIDGITVPAAAGGTVKLGFADASCVSVGTISIGSGKTLELYNGRTAGFASPHLNGEISGDETTLLKVTAGPGKGHLDHYATSTAFNGHVEIADGGFLYVGSYGRSGQGKTYRLSFTSSPERPFHIHGTDSTARFLSSDNNHCVMTSNAYFRVEDGGYLQLCGVNLQADQTAGPSVVVSNAFMQAQSETEGSHIHVRDINLYDRGVLELTFTPAAYKNQGLCIWDKIVAIAGESVIRRANGNPNHYCFMQGAAGSNATREGEIEVREGARVVFDYAAFSDAPHKTGAGTLVLGDRASVFGPNAKTLKLDGGYLLANAQTETLNVNLTTVQVADGAGFDLSERKELPWTPSFALTTADAEARTTVVIRLPTDRRLKSNTKVISWTTPPANLLNMNFRDAAGHIPLQKRTDGVYVARGMFVVLR